MRRVAPLSSRLIVLAGDLQPVVVLVRVTNRLFRNEAAEAAAEALLQLQLDVMRFADEYTGRIADQVVSFQRKHGRSRASDWSRKPGWSRRPPPAFTIATGPNPELNAIDMLVFVVLSRMVIDDYWINERVRLARRWPARRASGAGEPRLGNGGINC